MIFFDEKIGRRQGASSPCRDERPKIGAAPPWAGRGRALLAPMVGVSDIGMRRQAERFGAGLTFSEMIDADFYRSGDHILRDASKTAHKIKASGAGLARHIVQISARSPKTMAEAARRAMNEGACSIDINMGCPAKRVVGGYAGCALMRDPLLAARLIEAAVKAAGAPVSVKMRLGWDAENLNAPEIARLAEAAGASFLTVHGRTRAQLYRGKADWRAIAAVKAAVSIPVVANGDCASLEDARAMLAQSGADAVMIGRAAIGQPWLVGRISAGLDGRLWREPDPETKTQACLAHYDDLIAALGPEIGARHARKHLAAYADTAAREGFGLSPERRARLLRTSDPIEARALLSLCWRGAPRQLAGAA